MSDDQDRRTHPRARLRTRFLWSVVGRSDLQADRLRDMSVTGAFVTTDAVARVGEEIRFDLLDDSGERIASGLARVGRVEANVGMAIEFVAFGIDTTLVASIVQRLEEEDGGEAREAKRVLPPPLPGKVGGPPPLPGEHLQEEARTQAKAKEKKEGDDFELKVVDPMGPAPAGPEPQIEPLDVKRTGVIIGIDLGTTNTCASWVVNGRPKIIPGRTGTNTIPSMITFDPDGRAHVGQRAADRQILYPLRTVYGSKRLIGRTYRAELAAELQKHFAYPLGEAEGQRFGVRIDDRVISMDAIATRVLEEVRASAEEHLGVRVEAAVITVPAYFSEVQREAVRRAAREAKLAVHRIVNEPTAAAVAYGHKQAKKARVAVWDFGGGTFDFSVVDVSDGRLEVIATGGDNFVGGGDFDDLVASHLLGEFQEAHGISEDPTPQQIARLREAAEIAKRALSVQSEYLVELPEFTANPKRLLRAELTQEKFDELTKPLVERTVAIASEVMTSADIAPVEIDDVLLVGGTTRLPAVQAAVQHLFKRRPSKRINPDEAVAMGAALLADEIGSGSSPALLDILPMSVGHGVHGLRFVPTVARHARLPASGAVTVDADLLGTAVLPLFQGESPDVSRNEYLCSAVVEHVSLRDRGKVSFRLSFDEHCVMAVDASDARTGRPIEVTLDRSKKIEAVLRDLGKYEGPETPVIWQPPPSRMGRVLGKLFKLFGR